MTRREEAAKKLRKVNKGYGGWFITSDNAIYEIGKAIHAQGKPLEFFFNRLADIIDPVCHLIEGNDGDGIKYTCSNCGHFSVIELQLLDGFKYCPVCGARMVKGDDDEQ